MNRMKPLFAIVLMCLTSVCLAQTAKSAPKAASGDAAKPAAQTIAQTLDAQLKQVESELVPAVEAMPDDKFDFAPTSGEFNGVRTFALQARHVATTNFWLYSVVSGEKNPVELGKDENGSDTLKTKADIVKYLKDSYAFAHKALNSVPANGWTKEMPGPFGPKSKTSPLAMAVLLQGHQFDHYGQMVEYLRMNGIIPPASRPRGQ